MSHNLPMSVIRQQPSIAESISKFQYILLHQVDTRPVEKYSDIGGLDKQIQELIEAIVLPMTHKERFKNLGIQPPKGVLLYGPPGRFWTLINT